MNILLTIAARGGSKGVKDKNIRPLCGKPLIAVTIAQALAWKKASHIVVTTDSEAIAEVSKKYGAEVPFLRPAELATDTAAKVPVLRHALQTFEAMTHETFDIVVDLDPTAPVRRVEDLDRCLELFLTKKPKTLFSVIPAQKNPYFNMVEAGQDGFVHLSKSLPEGVSRRQDAPKVFAMNASIYFYSREYLLDPNVSSPISDRSVCYVMDELASLDIDREIDFKFVEFLAKEGLWTAR